MVSGRKTGSGQETGFGGDAGSRRDIVSGWETGRQDTGSGLDIVSGWETGFGGNTEDVIPKGGLDLTRS